MSSIVYLQNSLFIFYELINFYFLVLWYNYKIKCEKNLRKWMKKCHFRVIFMKTFEKIYFDELCPSIKLLKLLSGNKDYIFYANHFYFA